jgi:putative phosphoesterase
MRDCDAVLCAGDLLYQFRFSNDVLRLLDERGVLAILGNHDKTILHTRGHPLLTSPTVERSRLEYLAGLPSNRSLVFGNTRVAMFHGAPWDEVEGPIAHYIYPHDHTQMRALDEVGADIVVLGHTHVPFAARVGRTLVVNPGSCGEPRDETRTISYAVLDTESEHVEFFTLPLIVD